MPHSVPQQVRQQVSDIWEADLALQFMLLFLVVMLFVVVPLSDAGLIGVRGDLLIAAGFSLLGVSGVLAVARTTATRIAGLLAMTAPISLGWYHALLPGSQTGLLRAALVVIALGWMAALTLQHVFRRGAVTIARLQGAIAVYLLVALIFGELYWIVLRVNPQAFQLARDFGGSSAARSGVFYFSLITLTTVGYGDIAPVSAMARSLATLEALIGQLYPAILIGRLVSLQISSVGDNDRTPENQ